MVHISECTHEHTHQYHIIIVPFKKPKKALSIHSVCCTVCFVIVQVILKSVTVTAAVEVNAKYFIMTCDYVLSS